MSRLKVTYKEIIDIALPLMLGNMAWALIVITDQSFMVHFGKTFCFMKFAFPIIRCLNIRPTNQP